MEKYQKKTEQEKTAILSQKVKPGSGLDEYFLFAFNILIMIPFLIVLIPFVIIFKIVKMVQGRKQFRKVTYLEVEPASTISPLADRQYDVIVFGATGFTGKLVTEYLAQNYDSKNLKWAIAGRSENRLKEVRSFLSMTNPQMEELPILIADSNNVDQLTSVIKSTKVILTTVGPFSRYGSNTVALCAKFGTHYIDSTGEVAWVREMIQRYDNVAVKTGARIINCCGLDSIPWDLITYAAAEKLQKDNKQQLARIECYDEMYQAMSGGTFSTLQTSFLDPASKSKTEFDPLVKLLGKNEKSANVMKARTQKHLTYSSKIKKFIGMWGLADGNAGIVKRSNALLGYGSEMRYFEAYQYTNFFHGFNDQVKLIFIQFNMWLPPLLWLSNKVYFPQPGQGPNAHSMNQGYLKLRVQATGNDGAKQKLMFTLPDDPGYRDTARMLSEAALTLALNQKEITLGGGFLTPACVGKPFLKRLIDTGSSLIYE